MAEKKKPKRWLRQTFLLVTIGIDILMFLAVFVLMNHVQNLLNLDARINLTEIVTQNKDVITSRLNVEVNNLDLVAQQVSEQFAKIQTVGGNADLKRIFRDFAQSKGDDRIFLADPEGQAVYGNGSTVDISGRRYFKLALEGSSNISERTISRLNGEDIFIISVPVQVGGRTVGTVQKQYTPQEMYDLCAVSLFSKQGYMYIINREGYILISSQQDIYNRESDNYYRLVYLTNPQASQRLQDDIQNERAGFLETETDGQKTFAAYTPIDEVYGWYLISSVATNAVSPNAAIVIRLFYGILLVVVVFFGWSSFYYMRLQRRQQAKLERVAFFDPVTGGDTYAKFQLDLEDTLDKHPKQTFYLFAFDIDNFKYINSCYGFDVGDRILRAIYQLHESRLRANEHIARVSGDHFIMLISDAKPERLETLFSADMNIETLEVYLSAGLYQITGEEKSVSLMMDKANLAKQKIKGMRDRRVEVYSEEFDREMIRDELTKRSVEQALLDGEIVPYFQPKVDINTGKLVGAEALARWIDRDGQVISPGVFIPVCERTGLIVRLDMAIFEQTLQFIRANLDRGVACVPISVNFSRTHLLNGEFLEKLLGMLREYDVPPNLIEMELTETVIFDNFQFIESFIQQLHANGLQISMDDFGSGYSSLHMLKDVEIDVLKIDRGFLRDSIDSERQRTIFGAIVQMAEQLKMQVVVEGVENETNVAMMKEFGCTIAQGFLYAKPMPQPEFQRCYEEGVVC